MHHAVRAAAALLALTLLAECRKHEERYVTPWLKIDVARPVTGSSGVIVSGSSDEVFYSKVGDRWVRLGLGHASTYMTLDGEQAVLIDLHDNHGLQVIRAGDAAARSVQEVFARGDVSVLPGADAVDIFECRAPAEPAGCREAEISRYDVAGSRLESFPVAVPEAYSDCALMRIVGYDKDKIPYFATQCKMNSPQAKCLFVAPRKEKLFVYAVGQDRPWTECSDLSRAGVSLHEPHTFEVLR